MTTQAYNPRSPFPATTCGVENNAPDISSVTILFNELDHALQRQESAVSRLHTKIDSSLRQEPCNPGVDNYKSPQSSTPLCSILQAFVDRINDHNARLEDLSNRCEL